MIWYLRKQNRVSGPFPPKQLQQSILLGRVSLNDEVSKDKNEWVVIRQVAELIPPALKGDPADPMAHERLAAAKRWADERRGERREADDPSRIGPGRRTAEGTGALEYRFHRETVLKSLKQHRDKVLGGVILLVIVMGIGIYAGITFIPKTETGSQCNATAAPNVNWSHCNLSGLQLNNADLTGARLNSTKLNGANLPGIKLRGADIAYASFANAKLNMANLQNANAKGADFTAADLSNADLTNVDLSYANLRNAVLGSVNLKSTRLDHAIWIDGRTCQKGSIGVCKTP